MTRIDSKLFSVGVLLFAMTTAAACAGIPNSTNDRTAGQNFADADANADANGREVWRGTSLGGLYDVQIWPTDSVIEIGKLQSWIVRVHASGGLPAYPANITIGGGMQGHGHGLPTQPIVTAYNGGGEYLVEGVRFSMEGMWTFSVHVESALGSDRADFKLNVDF